MNTEIDNGIITSYSSFLKKSRKQLGQFENFILKLHDSNIRSILHIRDDLDIALLDMSLSEKAYEIENRFTSGVGYIDFPLILRFKKVNSARSYKVTEKGFLKRVRKEESKSKFIYLFEELLGISESSICLAIVLFNNSGKIMKDRYRLLLVDAEKIEVIENHEKIWESHFDNQYLDIYREYRYTFPELLTKNGA
ncbi:MULTISPECIES: hypothetical protein [unclassified Leptospira]|uniref:hypothetical protein n=1 Tax=unclassified Leptospira TaxID=2633828 RepID=UPI0002BD4E63|nr:MULTISPECIES: hypothetical protein [unclassified Leptospira]EMK02350.1 hypothetical protein LEP1GSC192_1754 [Leptospira sp. B5-022]MCR1795783.1 hypothetical protein [Leptospira sp. id769339]